MVESREPHRALDSPDLPQSLPIYAPTRFPEIILRFSNSVGTPGQEDSKPKEEDSPRKRAQRRKAARGFKGSEVGVLRTGVFRTRAPPYLPNASIIILFCKLPKKGP